MPRYLVHADHNTLAHLANQTVFVTKIRTRSYLTVFSLCLQCDKMPPKRLSRDPHAVYMRQWRENATDEQRQIWSKQASARRVRRRAAQKEEEEADRRKEVTKTEKEKKKRHAEAQARYRAKQKLKKCYLLP